jgi:hypothetical protein
MHAFSAYAESPQKRAVHDEIEDYIKHQNPFAHTNKGNALNKIIELINKYRFKPDDLYKQKEALDAVEGNKWQLIHDSPPTTTD